MTLTHSSDVKKAADAAREIEPFAKKASKEIKKKTFLGYFYVTITLMLVALFACMIISLVLFAGTLFPPEYKWTVQIIVIVIIIALGYFMFASIQSHKQAHKKRK